MQKKVKKVLQIEKVYISLLHQITKNKYYENSGSN